MKNFTFALSKELSKLLHKKKYFVFIIIGILFSLIRWGGSSIIKRITQGHVTVKTNMTMEMLPFTVEILVPIIIFIAVSDLFTQEYSNDTLKACIIQPITRLKLLTVKAAAVMCFAVSSVFIMFISNSIIQILSGGNLSKAGITFIAYLIDILPLIGITFMGILINTALKGPTSATLLSLALYAFMKYLGLYVSGSESFLFTSSAKLHLMLLGQTLPINILLYKFGILFGSILILYSVSYIIFERKNI